MPEILIVGQGLAGTVLAHQLENRGISFLIIDNPELSRSSKVAPGNVNPVVFKRMVKSWMADECTSYAYAFYSSVQNKLKAEFFWEKKILKLFTEDQEQKLWENKRNKNPYLSGDYFHDYEKKYLKYSGAAAVVNDCANLFVEKFLEESYHHWIDNNCIVREQFNHNALKINDSNVSYNGNTADKIIFCEGWKMLENPFFNKLPMNPAKGEVLIIKIENFNTDYIVHKGVSLLPIGNNLFVAGSTFRWDNLNDTVTFEAKNELLEKLKSVINTDFEVIDHLAGVRPAMADRRPVLGSHPLFKNLYLFNGLGAKGVLLSPYFANELIEYIYNDKSLNSEVSINRFARLFVNQ